MKLTTCKVNITNFATFFSSALCNLAQISWMELNNDSKETFEEAIGGVNKNDSLYVDLEVTMLELMIKRAKCIYYQSLNGRPEPRLDFVWKITFATIFTILMAISIISNAACGHLAYQYLKIEKTTSYTLMSLVISDLAHTLVLYPVEMNNLLYDMYWELSRYSCSVLPFLISTTNMSSSFTLCLIAVTRCWSVVQSCKNGPQPPNKFATHTVVAVVSSWIVAAALSSVCLITYNVQSFIWDERMMSCANDTSTTNMIYPTVDVCYYDSSIFKSEALTKYFLYVLPSFAFTPLFLIIASLYLYLSVFLWSVTPAGNSTHASKIRKRYKRVVTTLIGLVALFFVCRCPGVIYGYVVGLKETQVDSQMLATRFFLILFRFTNCILNPFCYGLLQDQFKINVTKLWLNVKKSCRWKKRTNRCQAASLESVQHLRSVEDSIGTAFFKGHVFLFNSLRSFTPNNIHSRVGVPRY